MIQRNSPDPNTIVLHGLRKAETFRCTCSRAQIQTTAMDPLLTVISGQTYSNAKQINGAKEMEEIIPAKIQNAG